MKGLAPTGRAAHQLADAGMPTTTLQRHLVEPSTAAEGQRRLYVLDESSLASTEADAHLPDSPRAAGLGAARR